MYNGLIKLIPDMDISSFLNNKYLAWQYEQGKKKTIGEFGALFGIDQPRMSLYMNGNRPPTPEHKRRIIEYYGDEAIRAFDENPKLHKVQRVWDLLTPEQQEEYSSRAEQQAEENVKRASKKRKTPTT